MATILEAKETLTTLAIHNVLSDYNGVGVTIPANRMSGIINTSNR